MLMAASCDQNPSLISNGNCKYTGTVVDLTGLDGCGLVVELADGTKLEAINLPESAQAGDRISFDYKVKTDLASICMVGEIVELSCYELLK